MKTVKNKKVQRKIYRFKNVSLLESDFAEFKTNLKQSSWNGNSNPPAWTWLYTNNGFGPKDLKTGKIGDWNHISSASTYPKNTDYVILKEELPEDTKTLFMFCKGNRILRGAIQFLVYYRDNEYKKFIDARASYYNELLSTLPFFWYTDYSATDEYEDVFIKILLETLKFFYMKNNKDEKNLDKIIDDSLGINREEPDHEIPKKIKDDEIDDP